MTRIGRSPEWCERGTSRRWRTTRLIDCQISGVAVPPFREFESSVPRWLWWLWSPDDPRFLRAALIHDVLLERGEMKEYADSQWLAVALNEGAPEFRARAAHLAMTARRFWLWAVKETNMKHDAVGYAVGGGAMTTPLWFEHLAFAAQVIGFVGGIIIVGLTIYNRLLENRKLRRELSDG